ncbi:nitrile hydratase subunit beta [Halosegnis sp.]|uniref:nitrile hydratase subunit beta n=1 Tax=Halosegnis sp. TaxID=2864959 RepID=UPI0035D46252
MDGIHDVGGMDGLGPVDTTTHEDTFHEPWEGATYAAFVAGLGSGTFGIDAFRHSIERMPPADYLTASYYDRWVRAITRLFVERGVLDGERVRKRTRAFAAGDASVPERSDPDLLGELAAGVVDAYDSDAPPSEPAFNEGDRVVVRSQSPSGHTRLPAYVRRATGTVTAYRGDHTYPDAAAHGTERSEPLYNVRFDAAELWGDRSDATAISLDLWEPYLRGIE